MDGLNLAIGLCVGLTLFEVVKALGRWVRSMYRWWFS